MPVSLVTGGAGFIGSHLVRALVARGDTVRVVDDLSTGRLSRLDPAAIGPGRPIEWVHADLSRPGVALDVTASVDAVFHLAAVASVPRTIDDPARSEAVNVGATVALFDAARRRGVRRVVFSSSSAVYGDRPESPKHEALPPAPASPYALQKLVGEQYAALFGQLHGLQVNCLRYFNVVGAGQDPAGAYAAVVPRWIEALRAGQPLAVFGDGLQTRDFVSVHDVVTANLRAAEAVVPAGLCLNVASGEATSLVALGQLLGDLLGAVPRFEHLPARPGDIRHSIGDVTRIREMLGWTPRSLPETLKNALHGSATLA